MSGESIPAALQRLVRERASARCEYCRLSQAGQEATFHVDHETPRARGGATTLDNLALSCVSCSLRKGARQEAEDPSSRHIEPLFNPRIERWDDHFIVHPDWRITGRTPTGRATVALLQMNRTLALAIRGEESQRGRFP